MGQGTTGRGAVGAGFCAVLAVRHRVLATLVAAALTGFSTEQQNGLLVFITARYRGGGKAADVGAFGIQGNAAHHLVGINTFETADHALQTGRGALVDGAQAVDFLLVEHGSAWLKSVIKY